VKDRFDDAFDWILQAEGGYVNDHYDPGGETKYGISKRAFPHLDIKNLTKKKALRVTQDGVIGNQTLAAAREAGPKKIDRLLAIRAAHFASIGKQRFMVGWMKRLFRLQRFVLNG